LYGSARLDPFGSYVVTQVCIHNPETNKNNCKLVPEEAHNCTSMLLLQQYGLVNSCNLKF